MSAEKKREYLRKYRRDRYRQRRDQGLCVICGGIAVPGRCHCEACHEKTIRKIRKARDEREANGRCRICGASLKEGGLCEACRENRKARKRYFREWMRKFYQARKERGLCVRCGAENDRPDRSACSACAMRLKLTASYGYRKAREMLEGQGQ